MKPGKVLTSLVKAVGGGGAVPGDRAGDPRRVHQGQRISGVHAGRIRTGGAVTLSLAYPKDDPATISDLSSRLGTQATTLPGARQRLIGHRAGIEGAWNDAAGGRAATGSCRTTTAVEASLCSPMAHDPRPARGLTGTAPPRPPCFSPAPPRLTPLPLVRSPPRRQRFSAPRRRSACRRSPRRSARMRELLVRAGR